MAAEGSDEPEAPRATLSACLITLNEEERLPEALASVSFCDEIVVVDSGSTDRTREIAREAGAIVIENPWPGFARQRNVALDRASSDWVLEIDADERVSPELRAEIEAFLREPPPEDIDMGALPLRDRFLGRELGPSAKYPKYRYRFFRRGSYRHDERRAVHEGLWAPRRVRAFHGDLRHELAATWGEAVRDARSYADLEATHGAEPGRPPGLLAGAVVRPAVKFGFRTFVHDGWRDGWQGIAWIGLECASDAAIVIKRRRNPEAPPSGRSEESHAGTVRIAAVASGAGATAAARGWLAEARRRGADTVLLSDAVGGPPSQDVHPMRRVGPILLVRALDAEDQLRPLDAVVPFGRRAARAARRLPGGLRGIAGVLEPGEEPSGVLAAVAAARPEGAKPPQ
jgi:hypothetical protein